MRCQRVFLSLLLYAATTLERTMSASTAGQRYRRCPDGQMLSLPPQWSDRVTSLAACLFQCNGDDQCLSLNVCPEGDGSGDVNCYFLYGASGDDETSVCAGLATAFLPTCYHVAKVFPPPEPTTVSTTEASTSTAIPAAAATTTATTTTAAATTTATTTAAATTTATTTTAAATTTAATTTDPPTTTTEAATTTTANTVPLNCQNGGTLLEDNTCLCTLLYAGQECDRYPRDCTEMKELAGESATGGTYSLHPVGSKFPVQVKCPFNEKGDTMVLQWYRGGPANPMVAHYTTDNAAFFVGLIDMYHILQQGDYTLQVWMDTGASFFPSAFYVNFTLLDGAGKYAMNYDSFYGQPSLDVANAWYETPALFHNLANNDPCAVTLGCGGWAFDNGCAARACLFQTATPTWSFVSWYGYDVVPMYNLEFYLTRTTPLV